MSLFRKIFLCVSTIVTLALLLFFVLAMQAAKDSINNQELVSIQADINQFDKIIQSGMEMQKASQAIFQNHSYESVIISDFLDNKLLQINNEVEKISGLAVALFGVENKNITAHLKDSSAANFKIVINTNDNHINSNIRHYFYSLFGIFFILLIIAHMVLYFVLKVMLQPFESIKNQIFHLSKNEYIENHKYSSTSDFKEVTMMLNEIVKYLRSKFQKDKQLVHNYYAVLYNDEETGLHNRTFFTLSLSTESDNMHHDRIGLVVFVKIINFDTINKTHGYEQIKNALNRLAHALEKLSMPYSVLARVKPDTFSYVISDNMTGDENKVFLKLYEEALEAINSELIHEKADIAVSSGEFKKGDSVKCLLSRVDIALGEAAMKRRGAKIVHAKESRRPLSKEERVDIIGYAFKNEEFFIELRPLEDLKSDKKNFLKTIVFLKDKDENVYEKSELISSLTEEGLMDKFDKIIINKIINKYRRINDPIKVMVTVTSEFMNSLEHIRWLGDKLEEVSQNKNLQICFCISYDIVCNEFQLAMKFAKLIQRFDHCLAVVGFIIDEQDQKHLQELKPDYIVIFQDYIEKLYNHNEKNKIRELRSIATNIEANLIAAYVENPKLIAQIPELKVDYLLKQ